MPSFATPPGVRFSYDQDGTVVLGHKPNQSISVTLSQAQTLLMNDEDTTDFFSFSAVYSPADGANVKYLTLVFPELRNLAGVMLWALNITATQTVQTSVDTTTGLDGTWVTQLSGNWAAATSLAQFRTAIQSIVVSNIKGVRIGTFDSGSYSNFYMAHFYGTKVTNAGLSFLHPTLAQALTAADLDFADVALGLTYTKTFRVKNNHATQQANGIVLQAVDVTNTAAYQFSDGGAFQSSLNIGNLAAGAISGVITIRRIVPTNETTQRPQHARLQAVPTSWT